MRILHTKKTRTITRLLLEAIHDSALLAQHWAVLEFNSYSTLALCHHRANAETSLWPKPRRMYVQGCAPGANVTGRLKLWTYTEPHTRECLL